MRMIIRALSVVVMVFCIWQIGSYFWSYKEVVEDQQQAQQSELAQLQQQNADIVGWLTLADSRLDHPVVQTTNNDFYLKHNYLRENSRGGSLYMDYRNEPMQDWHTIFYGHVLRNETMFGSLPKFVEQSYADEHPLFIYETADAVYELQVFAAYETTTDFYYIETEFTRETYGQFLATIQQRSVIDMQVEVTEQDRIVTFSTCTTSPNDKERFVVHAKVLEI